jgi:hypothetical protein
MTIAGYKKTIAKLLKAYHKKWDWQGKEITKKKKKRSKKRSKKRNRKRNKINRTC